MSARNLFTRLALGGLLAASLAIGGPAAAEQVGPAPSKKLDVVSLFAAGGANYVHQPVLSFAELRFVGIQRQTRDLSCGAAALATLLHGYFGLDADEETVIRGMLVGSDPDEQKKIAESGFSMLELKHYAESRGLVAGGFKTPKAEDLRKLRAPAIALVNSRGYNHFVVIRHVRGDEVAIADPVFGNRAENIKTFAKRWNNVILVVVGPGKVVQSAFMDLPPGIDPNPRDIQLYLSTFTSPPQIPQEGDYF